MGVTMSSINFNKDAKTGISVNTIFSAQYGSL